MQLVVRLRACPVDNTFGTFNIYDGIADVKVDNSVFLTYDCHIFLERK